MELSTDLPDLPAFEPLDKDRVKFLRERLKQFQKFTPSLGKIRTKLLAIGGLELVPQPEPEDGANAILKLGALASREKPLRKLGIPSRCHRNSSKLWLEDSRYDLHTGYGLSDDGLWRSHSWASKQGRIVETTEPRLLYFGRQLTGFDALHFSCSNCSEELHDLKFAPGRIALIKQVYAEKAKVHPPQSAMGKAPR